MRRINLTIDGLKTKKATTKAVAEQDIVWPTMLDDDQPGLCTVEVEFFDGATKLSGENYIEIPGWSGNVSQKGSVSFDLKDCGDFYFSNHTINVKYIGNAYAVDTDLIAAEYAENNENRWDRMPLWVVLDEAKRDDNKRWTFDEGKINLRFGLVKTEEGDPKREAAPDFALDNLLRAGVRIFDDEENPTKYRFTNIPLGSYGLRIGEVGSKTIGHYLHHNGGYAFDWLEPEGVLYSAFDTTDSKVKITGQPDFNADAISGRILHATGGRPKIQVFLMPRRWAYYCRLTTRKNNPVVLNFSRHWYWNDCNGTENFFPSDDPEGCHLGCWTVSAYGMRDGPEYPPPPFIAGTGWLSCSDSELSWRAIDLSFRRHYSIFSCSGSRSCTRCDISSDTWVTNFTEDPDYHRCIEPSRDPNHQYKCHYYQNFSVQRADWIYNMYLGLWYDRPPLGFKLYAPRYEVTSNNIFWLPTSLPEYATGEYSQLSAVCMVSDESRNEAIASLRAATGMNQEEAEALVISGYKSLHFHSGSDRLFYRHYLGTPGLAHTEHFNLGSTPDFGSFLTPLGGIYSGIYGPAGQSFPSRFDQIWTKIAASNFWANYSQYAATPSDGSTAVIRDDFPIGVGLCPNKAGTLLAVIKIGSRPYFVWQAEDEVFTERIVSVAGGYQGHAATLEPTLGRYVLSYDRDARGSLGVPGLGDTYGGPRGILYGLWIDQFSGPGQRKIDKMLTTYKLTCKKKFPRTDVNRCWTEPAVAGNITLEAPFWIMLSREYAEILDYTDRWCRSNEGTYEWNIPKDYRRRL